MNFLLLIPILFSFLLAVNGMPKWIKKCKKSGYLWEDMNKFEHPRNVASSGGFVVIMSFILGVLTYIAIRTLFIYSEEGTIEIFALLSVILIFTIVGLTDDFLGWKQHGLSKRFRLFFAVFASIPLIVINAGTSAVNFPFLGLIDFGIFYSLFFIPLGIAGASASFNMLAGFNGLEAGQGIIILSFFSYVAYVVGTPWLAMVGFIMVFPLFVFYLFNKYPAKVFPGDSLTWSVGALIAGMAILGNFEKIALFVFMPYFLEVGLKLRGGLKKESFGKPNKDGSISLPYEKIYGVTHLVIFILSKIKKKVYENEVTNVIHTTQILICFIAFIIFI